MALRPHTGFVASLLFFILLVCLAGAPANARQVSNSPAKGDLSSNFGWRKDPYTGQHRFHAGVDIAAAHGTPIYVPQDGIVVFSGRYKGYGNVVVVQHHPNLHTLYGHTSQIFAGYGQQVRRGQLIALVGSSGRSTGPHLHFEVRQNNGYVNPLDYLAYLSESHGPYVAQIPTVSAMTAPSIPQQWTQSVGGPEIPVSYQARASFSGNAIQAQHFRARPGKTVQVIRGSQVNVVQF